MPEKLKMENKWLDVTMPVTNKMVHWPGDIDVEVSKILSMDKGDEANVTVLHMCAHTGTHIDAPLHFIRNGDDVSHIPLETLMGNVKVIGIAHENTITTEEIISHRIVKGDRVFFKTINSKYDWSLEPFNEKYIYLSTPAAEYLKEQGVIVIGVDYLSVAGEENGTEVHRLLLENNILIIEGLNLRDVEPGNYEMICLPMKIASADGAPARVLIRKSNPRQVHL